MHLDQTKTYLVHFRSCLSFSDKLISELVITGLIARAWARKTIVSARYLILSLD